MRRLVYQPPVHDRDGLLSTRWAAVAASPAVVATCASVVYLRFAPRLDRSPADDGTDTDEAAPLKIGGSMIGLPRCSPLTEPLNPKGQERRPSLNV